MSLPPPFTQHFFAKLAKFAREFKMSRVTFALKAIEHYARTLRKENSPAAKALGSAKLADEHAEIIGKLSKNWWASQGEEYKSARGKAASAARWGTKKADKKASKKQS